ncbi:MAG: hypothetical protein ACE5I3_04940 [Phycisphaerae bacterium]
MLVRSSAALVLGGMLAAVPAGRGQAPFSFAPHLDLDAPARTLCIGDVLVEGRTVRVNGADSARPAKAFLFDWGDSQTTEAWFPTAHTYAHADRNYVLAVTARYPDRTDTVTADVRFVPTRYTCKRISTVPRRVFIPREAVALGSTMPGYEPPRELTCFEDADLRTVPREVIEYALDVGHHIQMDLCNGNVTSKAAARQVVLKQTRVGGCGSLWFTDPVSFVCHPSYLGGQVDFSSLLHELAHNLTLNSPAGYRFGGKTDGPMNTIVSETLAQIFQHATIHTILNSDRRFGLSDELCRRLRASGIKSIGVVREAYRDFLADPRQYTTYNDPATKHDDTFNTFMTVAYVFCELAEKRGDYRTPLKRMMRLMHTFSVADRQRFQQRENEPFRASFLVAAMSYGFDTDLRDRFRGLNFPVSDEIYTELPARMKGSGG